MKGSVRAEEGENVGDIHTFLLIRWIVFDEENQINGAVLSGLDSGQCAAMQSRRGA
jgi:hypothetical protein